LISMNRTTRTMMLHISQL